MRDPIQEHWADFVSAIREELTAHGRDSSILRVDSVALKVDLPLGGGADHTETFDTRAVLSGNADEMAARLYHRYEEAARG